jgi:signal transduction histidine kinase
VNYSTVLVISDDAEFPRSVQRRWQAESLTPNFIVVASDLCAGIDPESFDMAIVGGVRPDAANAVLAQLRATSKPVIFVHGEGPKSETLHKLHSSVITIPKQEGWLDVVVTIGCQALACAAAMARARAIELQNADLERQAALGRYTVEMRHSLNNALTSVLGNAELLLLDPNALGPEACSQIETIRNMALRIHEFLQRFTSIEKELSAAEKVGGRRTASEVVAQMAASH